MVWLSPNFVHTRPWIRWTTVTNLVTVRFPFPVKLSISCRILCFYMKPSNRKTVYLLLIFCIDSKFLNNAQFFLNWMCRPACMCLSTCLLVNLSIYLQLNSCIYLNVCASLYLSLYVCISLNIECISVSVFVCMY